MDINGLFFIIETLLLPMGCHISHLEIITRISTYTKTINMAQPSQPLTSKSLRTFEYHHSTDPFITYPMFLFSTLECIY